MKSLSLAFAALMYLWFLWEMAGSATGPGTSIVGGLLVGLGLLLDAINLVLSVARIRGRAISPIGGVPAILYCFGVPLWLNSWPWWAILFCIVAGGAVHYVCAWAVGTAGKGLRSTD